MCAAEVRAGEVRLLRPLAAAVALACAGSAALAQQPARQLDPAPRATQVVPALAHNARVHEVIVAIERAAFVADGVTRVPVRVELRDRDGKRLTTPATVTLEASGGRILLPGAGTDETGPGALDRDRATPGVQLEVVQGEGHFWLLAPATPQDVRLRVTAGAAVAEGLVTFNPELRELLAVGLVEGVIALRRGDRDAIRPASIDDGFEQELRSWSHRFGADDRDSAAVRAALFLKGKIRGDALLTLAYDSERDERKRLMRDVRPDEYYPVYGDASVRNFDAQSASKLYVRIDKDRSYLLYGDFTTAAQFTPLTGGIRAAPLRLRDLGQYNRTVTGVRGRWADERGELGAFATRDTLRQAVEEYPANGTSGPFAVRSSGALAGSERVEVITRDRNNRAVILSVEPLARLVDYVFEPFSGRILLNRPVASLDPNGNPVSIRISYEIDQGGDPFWLYGVDGQWRIAAGVEVGGALVDDRNELAPYRLGSANLGLRLGRGTQLVAEVARSQGMLRGAVQPPPNDPLVDASGNAARVALEHKAERSEARVYYGRSDSGFSNSSASFSGGRGDAGARGAYKLTESLMLFGEAVRSEDRATDARRDGAQAGVALKLNEALTIELAIKHQQENGRLPGATLAANPAATTGTSSGALTPSGGFFGTGSGALDPASGTSLTPAAGTRSGTAPPLDATTVQLGLRWQPAAAWSLAAEAEQEITGDDKKRLAVSGAYALAERSRLYARWETQQGLASIYSLNPAERSTTFVFGADTTYRADAQFYSEYRLRDALGDPIAARESQLANGLRNTWTLAPGLRAVTAAEYLRVLDGAGRAAIALAGGLDYTAHPLWKGSTRLEWRRLQDDPITSVADAQDSWLSTITVARKLDRDWTLLARNYALLNTFQAGGERLQDRFQLGLAYRPVDHNRFNALGKYEFKFERDESGLPVPLAGTTAAPAERQVHIVSLHGDWHPSRPWWLTGRVAAKSLKERLPAIGSSGRWDRYEAYLLGGRAVLDLTERWDLGVLASALYSPQGSSLQHALGVEAGYLLKTNLWLSLGVNFTGFSDRDLTAGEYTAQGVFLRLRFKFDERLLAGGDPDISRALGRPPP